MTHTHIFTHTYTRTLRPCHYRHTGKETYMHAYIRCSANISSRARKQSLAHSYKIFSSNKVNFLLPCGTLFIAALLYLDDLTYGLQLLLLHHPININAVNSNRIYLHAVAS